MPKRKFRWYQYSLRTLLIFVTLFAVACSWFAVQMQKARRQKEIRQAVENEGGNSMYEYQVEAQERLKHDKFDSEAAALLSDTSDSDFFDNVSKVCLANSSTLTDSDLAMLGWLKHLRELDLHHTQITDAGLKHILGLKELRFLDLQETKVTDAGVATLKKALPKCWIER
jgi:hypothetical protein